MEEKSNSWVLTLLSSRKEQIPIVDTIIFLEGRPYKTLSNKSTTEIHETQSKPLETLLSTFSSLDCLPSKTILCLFQKSLCNYIKKGEVRLLSRETFNNTDQVQLLYTKKNLKHSSSLICDISYINHRYKIEISAKNKSGLTKLNNPPVKSKAKEICAKIIRAIKFEESGQLLKVKIEFFMDSQNNLYLHQATNCILALSFSSKHNSLCSKEEFNDFLSSGKKVRTKSLFERNPELQELEGDFEISFDSIDDEQVLKLPEPQNNLRPSKDARLKRRTLNSHVKSFEFIRTDRKATIMPGVTNRKPDLIESEDKFEDSWDYGSMDVNFLEMISRQAIRGGNLPRPISPTYDEIKSKMKQINEKYSFAPYDKRKTETKSDLFKIRVNGEDLRKSILNNIEKTSPFGLPLLSKKPKSVSNSYGDLLKSCKNGTVQRKSLNNLQY